MQASSSPTQLIFLESFWGSLRVRGQWKYWYQAVDIAGNTVDVLLRAKHDKAAARRFLVCAIACQGEPETITIDKSGASRAALQAINTGRDTPIRIRQAKYLNNLVEQAPRAIKRIVRPMLGFKRFRCVRFILAGIEIMHAIAKGQMHFEGSIRLSPAQQFYSLAG
ncbi:transposase [Azorhizophilus paspali]|uniref:Transposase n=1 Tax=Azorhizophilus paspali TaxID=69963 RepID=A0ABV6SU45_AZOPA